MPLAPAPGNPTVGFPSATDFYSLRLVDGDAVAACANPNAAVQVGCARLSVEPQGHLFRQITFILHR